MARARWCCSRASPGSASRASCASCASGSRRAARPLLYQCSPHHQTSPLHPVIEQLERAAGFERDDPPEAQARQARGAARARHRQLDEAVPLLARCSASRPASATRCLDLTPAAPEAAHARGAGRSARGPARRQPLLIFEDAQWIDPTSQELLGLTIERIQRLPVLCSSPSDPSSRRPGGPAARHRAVAQPAQPAAGAGDGGGSPAARPCRPRSSSRSWRAPTACRCSSRS